MPITPHLVIQGADGAAAFYHDAFGAEELDRIPIPDGRLMSVQLRLDDGLLHIADEGSEIGHASHGAHAPLLAEDVCVLEGVERAHVRRASERRVSARRRHDLREITD